MDEKLKKEIYRLSLSEPLAHFIIMQVGSGMSWEDAIAIAFIALCKSHNQIKSEYVKLLERKGSPVILKM